MSSLANQQQNLSFPGLLQVPGGITSALQQVQDGNGNPTGLSLSATAAVTSSETFTVKDFGAVGNGIANDTVAIQTAITQAAAYGRSLFFNDGTYLISSLTVPANSYLYGESQNGVILKKYGISNVDLVVCTGSNVIVKSMTLDNENATNYQILNLGTNSNMLVSRVTFKNASLTRPALRSDWITQVSNIEVTDCYFDTCLYGGVWFLTSVRGHKNITVSRNTFTNCGGTIIGIKDAALTDRWCTHFAVDVSFNKMINLSTTGTYGAIPIEAWGIYGYTCIGNYIDSGTRGLTGGARMINGVISGNTVMNQTLYAMEAGPSINVEVSDNTFLNCATAISFTGTFDTDQFVENYKINNNVIKGGGQAYVAGRDCIATTTRFPFKDLVISGNTFKDPVFQRTVIRATASQATPNITFTDSAGTGAIASATLKAASGAVIYGGTGYTSPTLTVDSGDGAGMDLTANVTAGVITGINIVNAGTGYTSEPTIMVTDATGQGAILKVSMGIDAVAIINGGSGYVAPTVVINNNGGYGFTGTVQQSAGIITGVTVTTAGNGFGREGTVEISNNNIQLNSQYCPETGIVAQGGKVLIRNNYILSNRYVGNLVGAIGYNLINVDTTVTNGLGNPIFDISDNTLISTNTYSGSSTYYAAISNVAAPGKYYGHIIRNNYVEGNFRSTVIADASNADPIIFNNNTINTTLTGTYSRNTSYSNTILVASGTAAPVAGTWRRGDIVKNSTPTVGQPQGWVCTVAGTPGTWVSEGNL